MIFSCSIVVKNNASTRTSENINDNYQYDFKTESPADDQRVSSLIDLAVKTLESNKGN